MKVQRLCYLLLFLGISCHSEAQTSQQTKLLPMLAPSSPEVASLGRYGTYEVNMFTGVPDISLPIYDVRVGELSLPIRLSYHASGIKVSETASRVGLGWSFDAGGTITRKIQGKPDEQTNNYFAATSASSYRVRLTGEINGYADSSLDYLTRVDVRQYDGEPDIFTYNFPGHTGRFLFNQKDNFKPFLVPFAPVDVSKTYVDAITVNFSLKDEGGRKYSFNNVETTSSGSAVGLQANTTSAWLLSEMVSANTQDTIRLKYSSVSTSDKYENEYFIINDNAQTSGGSGGSDGYYTNDLGTFSGEIVSVSTNSQRLDSITFLTGKVVFEEAPEARTDFNGIYNTLKRLKFVKVYSFDPVSKAYSLIKIIQLFHSYFMNGSDNTTARLRLDSIQVLTPTNVAIQTYRFDYNTSISLPGKMAKVKDWWGYYNNRTNVIPNTSTPTSIPKLKHTYAAPPGSPYDIWIGGTDTLARYPDPNYMQAYVLQKITFPTGGFTQFEYETNQYFDDNGNPKFAGGLRIKSVKNYTAADATPITKTYRYGLNESGYGRANFFLEQCFFANHQNFRWVDVGVNPDGSCRHSSTKTMHTYFANPTNDIEGSDGSPVFYNVVTEYDGDSAINNGKTIYQFSDKADAKTSIIGYGKPFFDSYQFIRGLQTGKAVYKANGNGTYQVVYEERKKYQFYPFQWTTQGIGIVVKKNTIDQGTTGIYDYIGLSYGNNCAVFSDANMYSFNNYNIVSGDNKLITDTAITYDQKDTTKSFSVITNYTYDDSTHLGLSQIQTTNSKSEMLKTIYTYPYSVGTTPYTGMDSAHIWLKPVTTTTFNGSTQITQQITNYSRLSGNNYLPANIQVKIKANAVETRALFNQYDTRGNILEMQKANDIKQSLIWDYRGFLPIAEVAGAAQSDIAYTSFEADGTGGWSGIASGLSYAVNGSVTGKRAYTQSGFSFTKSGLSNMTTYTVSYWSKSGSYSVTSSSPTLIRTLNGWTLYQHTVVNPSGGTITVSGSGTIDELRLYPSIAMMKTYTYEPLTGLSSTCDVNNHILYYYYDGIGRLSFLKDENNYIIQKNCYNYFGQPGNCSLYGNTAQSANYTRNNCTGGYVGSQVTYTVPANTYYASSQTDANTLAQNDVAANGQAYANATGTCSPPPITITGSNSKSISYTVKFTKSSNSSVWYSFSLSSGASNATLGTIPQDTYNVQFQPNGNPPLANFNITTYTLTNATGATFNNVSLTSNALARVY